VPALLQARIGGGERGQKPAHLAKVPPRLLQTFGPGEVASRICAPAQAFGHLRFDAQGTGGGGQSGGDLLRLRGQPLEAIRGQQGTRTVQGPEGRADRVEHGRRKRLLGKGRDGHRCLGVGARSLRTKRREPLRAHREVIAGGGLCCGGGDRDVEGPGPAHGQIDLGPVAAVSLLRYRSRLLHLGHGAHGGHAGRDLDLRPRDRCAVAPGDGQQEGVALLPRRVWLEAGGKRQRPRLLFHGGRAAARGQGLAGKPRHQRPAKPDGQGQNRHREDHPPHSPPNDSKYCRRHFPSPCSGSPGMPPTAVCSSARRRWTSACTSCHRSSTDRRFRSASIRAVKVFLPASKPARAAAT